MASYAALACLALASTVAHGQISATNPTGDTLTASEVEEPQQRALFNSSSFIFNFDTGTPAVSNAAGTIVPMDVSANGLLATLPLPGVSLNRGVLNPCVILLPHVHPRATEIYFAVDGNFSVGLVQENGAPAINGTMAANSAFVVPQGLIHFNANFGCTPAVFTQTFSNIDPGLITLPAVLPNFSPSLLASSGLSASASSLGPFAVDAACSARCGSAPAPSTSSAGK